MASKRIYKERKLLKESPIIQSYFQYDNSQEDDAFDPFVMYGYILPHRVPYKYGSFKVMIKFPIDYPFKPPKFYLLTHIYHPIVSSSVSNPHICGDCTCFQWHPRNTVFDLIKHIVNAIDRPEHRELYCINNVEAHKLFAENRTEFETIALNMVKKYACPRVCLSIISLKLTIKTMILVKLNFDSTKIDQLPVSKSLIQYLKSASPQ
ncbi:unnamed protein product [Rotaria sp. Silwood2]|nr:unnamed protein product [Rotaria sp. Silwood2]